MDGDDLWVEQLVGSGSPFVEVLAPDVRLMFSGKDGLDFVGVRHRVVQDVDVDDSGSRLVWAIVVFSGTYAEDFLIHESLSFRSGGTDEDELSVGGRQRGEHGCFHGHDVYFLRFVHDYLGDGKATDVACLVVERPEMATGTGIGVLDVVLPVLVQEHRVRAVLGLERGDGLEHVVLYDVGCRLLEGHYYRVVVREERFLYEQLGKREGLSHLSGTVDDNHVLCCVKQFLLPGDAYWGMGF